MQDFQFNGVQTGILAAFNCSREPTSAGSVVIEIVDFTGAITVVQSSNGRRTPEAVQVSIQVYDSTFPELTSTKHVGCQLAYRWLH